MRSSHLPGIAMMCGATFTFALMDACMKQLAEHYPPLQVAFLRGIAALPFVFAWVGYRERRYRVLLEVRWAWHVARGALAVLLLGSFIYSLSRMPMSEAYSLFFVAPLLITALSAPLLGEHVSAAKWIAIIVGFGGVLIALQPGADTDVLGAIGALVGATCYALNAISTRILGRTDSTAAMAFWFTAFLAIGAGLLALPGWKPLQLGDAWWIVGVGLTGAIAQLLLTSAFRIAPAALLAPFEYTALLWGTLLDIALWQVLPSGVVLAGAGVIVASGLFLLRAEKRPVPVSPP
ncbi:MAG: DMT family transporter [Gammaproteobacteria bacterium]|nr:DMT family transporter [Gammaproteobacteria bacterium]